MFLKKMFLCFWSELVKLAPQQRKSTKNHLWEGSRLGDLAPQVQLEIRSTLIGIHERYSRADLTELTLSCKTEEQKKYASQPMGEHYQLLSSIISYLDRGKSFTVVEIGTLTGMSARTMLNASKNVRVVSFDLVHWKDFADTVLTDRDFESGKLEQFLGDLSETKFWNLHQNVLENASFILVDGPKDSKFEQSFVPKLLDLSFIHSPLILLDDIHFRSMKNLWNLISDPKVDLSCIGHASGSGLIFPKKNFS